MASTLTKIGLPVVLLGAVLYQLLLKDLIFVVYGFGRTAQPISDFPYKCHQIKDPKLQACEDMWLHHKSRTLFLACSDPISRKEWLPNIARFNASGRPLNDHVIAMPIDNLRLDRPTYTELATPGFSGVNGDASINVLGITGEEAPDGKLCLWLVNTRPSIDLITGELLDNEVVGANSTIEMFQHKPGSNGMLHMKTFADPLIATPNNIAANGDGSFYFTNDHGLHKTGRMHELTTMYGGGDVTYCPASGPCKLVSSSHKFPNGLMRGTDGLIYVPSAAVGSITVYAPQSDASLKQIAKIDIPYAIDNLSQDQNGDIYVPVFPEIRRTMTAFDDPLGPGSSAAAMRVTTVGNEYEVVKLIEDKDAEVLPMTTTVIHDARTGRLFFSGVLSPFITVCEQT